MYMAYFHGKHYNNKDGDDDHEGTVTPKIFST